MSESPESNYRRAFLVLEEPIREADYMVSIVANLVHDLFESYGEQEGENEVLTMPMRDHDRLIWAVGRASESAAKVGQAFEAACRAGTAA